MQDGYIHKGGKGQKNTTTYHKTAMGNSSEVGLVSYKNVINAPCPEPPNPFYVCYFSRMITP